MYLPRPQISQLYNDLVKSTHPLSPSVLVLTALTVDALCSTRMLTSLLKRDYIPHKVQPVSGYNELQKAGQDLVLPLTRQRGGDGGLVICLGVGGLVDLEEVLGLDASIEEGQPQMDMRDHGVEVWVIDARRPWNLQNIFGSGVQHGDDPASKRTGVDQGRLLPTYRPGKGGVIVWDDGDIEHELASEREAFMTLQDMPEITEDDLLEGADDQDDDDEPSSSQSSKRKGQDSDEEEDASDDEHARKRRRSNSNTPIPSSPGGNPFSAQIASTPPTFGSSHPQSPGAVILPSSPPKERSARQLKHKLLKLRRKHEATLESYYNLGTCYAEPVSSIIYSLASELGREDNDLLWLAIVGISSVELSPYSQPQSSIAKAAGKKVMDRAEQVREILRDEVRRLNPIPESELVRTQSTDIIPTHARSPTDTSIRLSPEPRFLLIRHWSLYDSMLHSSYLATRLHVWSDSGRKRLHKLLAKMGISLQEAGKGYVHMDMELKRSLRQRLLRFADQYNLDGLVPGDDGRTGKEGWGFVRSWGWKATLSAADVAYICGAILEVGAETHIFPEVKYDPHGKLAGNGINYNTRMRTLPTPPHSDDGLMAENAMSEAPDWTTARFFAAYDALNPASSTSTTQGLDVLLQHIQTAQHLSRAILRTGSALVSKKQIRHLRAFRMAVVKEGPDVSLFTHPGALVKLAAWVSEAVAVLEAEKGRKRKGAQEALVLGCLDETRGVYMVVGLGGSGTNGNRPKSKAEIREKEEKRKRKEAARAAKKTERARKRADRRQLRREINEANGIIDSDDEAEDSDGTESTVSSESDADSDDSDVDEELAEKRSQRGYGLNRFGQAFQEVVEETATRVRIDSFEHSVVEVRKEDLSGFLEALSLRSVVG